MTILFFFVLPDRSILVHVSSALLGLVALALNARFTTDVVWAPFPLATSKNVRWRRCFADVLPVTLIAGLLCFGLGLLLGYLDNGWPTAWRRVANWHILLAVCVYFPWALVQQTLCQFYLLGRLYALLPSTAAIMCTGMAFGLVHVPNLEMMAVTAAAGLFWTYLYSRYRVLLPLAVSHAMLGSTLQYWIYGEDLVAAWQQRILGVL